MFASILGVLSSRVTQLGLALFAILSVYMWGDSWRDKAKALMSENALIRIDLQSLKTANEEAEKRALAEKKAKEAIDAQWKEKIDAQIAQTRRDKRAIVDAYARANRVRKPQAPEGSSGCTNLSGTSTTSGGLDGPCPDAEYVALTRPDFDILIDNSIRLQNAHEWAVGR